MTIHGQALLLACLLAASCSVIFCEEQGVCSQPVGTLRGPSVLSGTTPISARSATEQSPRTQPDQPLMCVLRFNHRGRVVCAAVPVHSQADGICRRTARRRAASTLATASSRGPAQPQAAAGAAGAAPRKSHGRGATAAPLPPSCARCACSIPENSNAGRRGLGTAAAVHAEIYRYRYIDIEIRLQAWTWCGSLPFVASARTHTWIHMHEYIDR